MISSDDLITKVQVPDFNPKLLYSETITMLGSCFTEHISNKLGRYKYDILTNPFGILYNPVSIAISLDRIVHHRYYTTEELVLHDGLYHSMDHHGSWSGNNSQEVIQKINASINQAHEQLKKSSFVFISPGTSKVYQYLLTKEIAGNCHKIPQSQFEYTQLSLAECENALERIQSSIHSISPNAHLIWTVSPVRHIRDGLIENQISKSTLILAIAQSLKRHPNSGYFPAYEIMMDQLRDYRYYKRDLIHPSDVAIDIIWDIFCNTFLDPQERAHHGLIEKIKRAMEHRFLHDDQEAIRTFAQNQLKQIEHMATILPDLNWQEERQHFFHLLEMD